MNDLNSVTLSGRLTRDPELKYTPSGVAILNFSIASNYSKKENGAWTEKASFFDCVLIGKLGEALSKKMTKGAKVHLLAEARQRAWEDQQGQKKSRVEFLVGSIDLSSGSFKSESTEQFPDDEIPF